MWIHATRVILGVLVLVLAASASAQEAFTVRSPTPGEIVYDTAPAIVIDVAPGLDPDSATMTVDGTDVTVQEEAFDVNPTNITYAVPVFLPYADGMHNVTVSGDFGGKTESYTFNFTTSSAPPPQDETSGSITLQQLVIGICVALGLSAIAFAAWILYLRRTRNFTFQKFFAKHPGQKRLLMLYVPMALASVGCLAALAFVPDQSWAPRYTTEWVLVATAILGLGPFAWDVSRQQKRRNAFERAFAQFLFELADAVRGGLDPLKGLREIAKSETGLLKPYLAVASDQIRLGRPFDQVLRTMVLDMGSPLIARYASLVGEAAATGGEVSSIIHRAAKDMDELVLIEEERARQMRNPIMTIYIAFGVFMLMTASMMDFAPQLSGIDLGSIGGGGPSVPKTPLSVLQDHFFHLAIVNAVGAGFLIGGFLRGDIRAGLFHVLVMVTVAALVFPMTLPTEEALDDGVVGGEAWEGTPVPPDPAAAPAVAPLGPFLVTVGVTGR